MRTLLVILLSMITCLFAEAQSHVPISTRVPYPPFTVYPSFIPYPSSDSTHGNHKWQLQHFASLSAGFIFGNGGMSYVAAPFGLALVRPLNNNLSAFGAISAAPVLFNINRLYTDPALNSYPGNFSRPYNLNLNARVEAGFIYTNDAKTFSISGSVGVEKSSYPVYPSSNGAHIKKQ